MEWETDWSHWTFFIGRRQDHEEGQMQSARCPFLMNSIDHADLRTQPPNSQGHMKRGRCHRDFSNSVD